MTLRTAAVTPAVIALALAASACGESDEEKAQERVCDARAGISTEVEKLGALTPSTVTGDAVRASLESIRGDLKAIGEARADVNQDRRDELTAANNAFAATVRDVGEERAAEHVRRGRAGAAVDRGDGLAATYRSTLGRYDCG